MNKLLSTCLIAVAAFCGAVAQNPADSAKIYFRINHRQFDPSIGDNAATMARFVNSVRAARDSDDIYRLVVRSYASPDGSDNANTRLTANRCAEIVKHIVSNTGISADLMESVPEGVAWDELRRIVAETPEVPCRDQVLDILDNTPLWVYDDAGRIVDGRKKQLMIVDGGNSYRWMFDNIFPRLRNAVAVSLFLKSDVRAAKDAAANAARAASDAANAAAVAARAAAVASKAAADAARGTADAVRAAEEAAQAAAKAAADAQVAATQATQAAAEATAAADAAQTADDVAGARAKAAEAQAAQAAAEAARAAAEASQSAAEAARAAAEAIAAQVAAANGGDSKDSQALNDSKNLDGSKVAKSVEEKGDPLHRFALKTNLLYYAALMPNFELQWRMNELWTLSLDANIAWWSSEAKHKYYQIAMISPELRRWINPRGPWHGMYAGVFVGGGWYDLENGKTGYKGEGGLAGVSFGYMWPVSRCISLEAGLGVGYLYTRHREYIPYDGHYLYQRKSTFNYVGPLKLKFSIAWRFDDINKKKGVRAL